MRTVVDRMAQGVGNAAAPVRAVIDGYLDLCRCDLRVVDGAYTEDQLPARDIAAPECT